MEAEMAAAAFAVAAAVSAAAAIIGEICFLWVEVEEPPDAVEEAVDAEYGMGGACVCKCVCCWTIFRLSGFM